MGSHFSCSRCGRSSDAAVVGTHHESGLDWCTSCCEAILEEMIRNDKEKTFQLVRSLSVNGPLGLSVNCEGCKRKIYPVHDILYLRGRKCYQYWPYDYQYLDDKCQVLGSFSVSRTIFYDEPCPKLSEDTPHKLALDNFRIYRSKCSACIALDAKKEKEADEKRAQKEKEKNRLQELRRCDKCTGKGFIESCTPISEMFQCECPYRLGRTTSEDISYDTWQMEQSVRGHEIVSVTDKCKACGGNGYFDKGIGFNVWRKTSEAKQSKVP